MARERERKRELVMSADTFKELNRHFAHDIQVVRYGRGGEVFNVAVECQECNEVLMDYDKEEASE